MADDRGFVALGYLRVEGRGGVRVSEIRDLLGAVEAAYQAVARVEVAAESLLERSEWAERYGPPLRYWPPAWLSQTPLPSSLRAADPLVVSRVELSSPGFWEFFGGSSPLEVLRKYLKDRHGRSGDAARWPAEHRRLELENDRRAIDNAMGSIKVVERLYKLERRHGAELYESQAWRRVMGAELREPLEQLGDFDTRRLIDGGSAQYGPEQLDDPEPPDDPSAD